MLQELFSVVAAVVHSGELQFEAVNRDESAIKNMGPVRIIAKLLKIEEAVVRDCFTHKYDWRRGKIGGDWRGLWLWLWTLV